MSQNSIHRQPQNDAPVKVGAMLLCSHMLPKSVEQNVWGCLFGDPWAPKMHKSCHACEGSGGGGSGGGVSEEGWNNLKTIWKQFGGNLTAIELQMGTSWGQIKDNLKTWPATLMVCLHSCQDICLK